MKKSKPVLLAVISDVHAGGSTALAPDTIPLDDGGEYHASKAQRWLWQNWEDFWRQTALLRAKLKAELYVISNGDLVDGAHHDTTQLASENPNAQAAVVNAAMAVILAQSPDRLVFIRGTEAHVGKSGSAEERIADGLRRDKRPVIVDPDTNTSSHWHWRAEIQGVRLDVTHHGRTGLREHTRGSAAVLHAHDILLAHAKAGHPYPHLCFRGHHHKFNDSGDACPVRVITTGAWQLPTAYVKKVAADSLSDIGGCLVVIQDGQYTVQRIQYQPERPVWRPT